MLSFLYAPDLCRVAEVSRTWRALANDPTLWKRLIVRDWLPPARSRDMLRPFAYHRADGAVAHKYKQAYQHRWRLRRNWLQGRCTVRTFAGHRGCVFCVQFDGRRIVSGRRRDDPRVVPHEHAEHARADGAHGHGALPAPGRRPLLSGSADHTIWQWDSTRASARPS